MPMQISISNAIRGGAQGSGGGSSFASTNSFTFDGNSDYVGCGDVLNLDITDTFSFSQWVKFNSLGTDEVIISKWSSASSFKGYVIYKNSSDKIVVFLRESNIKFNLFVSTNTLSSGVWYNITLTYDGSRLNSGINLYFDGVPQAGARSGNFYTGSMITTLPFNIGARNNGELPLNGFIDEVSVFNSELSGGFAGSDVTAIYNNGVPNDLSSFNPISWWRMGEEATNAGKGWVLTDQGSGGNNGFSDTLPAPPAQPSTDVPT